MDFDGIYRFSDSDIGMDVLTFSMSALVIIISDVALACSPASDRRTTSCPLNKYTIKRKINLSFMTYEFDINIIQS
jgi:hypothetical protein